MSGPNITRKTDFSGAWRFAYWYPSNDHDGDDVSEYDVRAFQMGDQLVLESMPNRDDSYIFVRLTVDNDLATGTWYETTSPHGTFKGMTYSGAGQLIMSHDRRTMKGQWAGMGIDRSSQKRQIYTGRWELASMPNISGQVNLAGIDFSGIWLSQLKHSKTPHRTDESLHYVTIRQKDDQLMIGGIPHGGNSSIVLRLTLDGLVATGTWQEHFSPSNFDKGLIHHGSVQLLVDPIKKRLVGKWVGFGNGMKIGTGEWEFTYIGNQLPKDTY